MTLSPNVVQVGKGDIKPNQWYLIADDLSFREVPPELGKDLDDRIFQRGDAPPLTALIDKPASPAELKKQENNPPPKEEDHGLPSWVWWLIIILILYLLLNAN